MKKFQVNLPIGKYKMTYLELCDLQCKVKEYINVIEKELYIKDLRDCEDIYSK